MEDEQKNGEPKHRTKPQGQEHHHHSRAAVLPVERPNGVEWDAILKACLEHTRRPQAANGQEGTQNHSSPSEKGMAPFLNFLATPFGRRGLGL